MANNNGSDPLWYKDAIIYEVHVRAFHDHLGDGFGDFRGLTQKLDYLQDLGVTAIWLGMLGFTFYQAGGIRSVDPFYGTVNGISISSVEVLMIVGMIFLFIFIIERRRARVWLVDVEEEHKDWQEVIPERKKTA